MHPRLQELSALLDAHRATLLNAVAAVPSADRERRVGDDEWTVAQVVDHLATVERGTAGLLAKRAQRAREAGVGPDLETSSVADRMNHARIADNPARLEAPEIVRPRPTCDCADALSALAASRDALRETIAAFESVDATKVTARHAVFGEIDGYQWLLFLGQHELRHARQIANIAERLRAP